MVNEQIQTILNKLTDENSHLVVEHGALAEFITQCQSDSAPISLIVNSLLTTIQEQAEVISQQSQTITNYQAQTQGIYSRLQRRPRRLSLQEKQGVEWLSPTLSPRVGSLATYYDRPSPRQRFGSLPNSQVSSPTPVDYSSSSSPRSVHSPVGNPPPNLNIPQLDEVLEEIVQENEIAEAQAEQVKTLQQKEFALHQQLTARDKEITRLEENRASLLQQLQDQATQIKKLGEQITHFQADLTEQASENKSLRAELTQTNNDLYQGMVEKNNWAKLLRLEQEKNQKLEEQLTQEINDNERSRKKRDTDNSRLLNEFERLMKANTFAHQEVDSLRQLLADKEEQYRQERIEQQKEYRKKLERVIQLQDSQENVRPTKSSHVRSSSFTSSSYHNYLAESQVAGGPSLNSPTFLFEVQRTKRANSNVPPELTSSPPSEKTEPLNSTSEEWEQSMQVVMNLVDDALTIPAEPTAREEALLNTVDQLSDNQLHLESFWKELKEKYDDLEKSTAELRSQLLVSENERQKLQELIAELEYRLAEAQDHHLRAEKKLGDQAEELTTLNQTITELTAEKDRLEKRLATAQQQLDDKYSDRSWLNGIASRRAAIAADSGGALKKEQAEHATTKKQLLTHQQEVEQLKAEIQASKAVTIAELERLNNQATQAYQQTQILFEQFKKI
jgi:hypothetical protein